ncbi:MAG: polar amino acid transport system permease protein [Pseudonocardiales bacterium]|nr:polar amino acid transport system permease protein [Pseudonocardiales bacterium]MDT4942679.1 polar amino acid transport system permease protein [Pseudonocardiales bacterium]
MATTSWQPSQLQRERDAYRRSRTRRSWLIALASTAIVVTVAVLVVRSSSGWDRTRDSFFDFRTGWHDLPDLLRALWTNVKIMLVSEAFILVFAAVIAILRTLRGPVFFPIRFVCAAYVDIFRGLPLLIVLFLVGFGIPSLRLQGGPTSEFTLCVIALTLTYTAYVAEVFRAGIESVHPSQAASARALGLTYAQSMRYVIFPQAVRRVLPPLLNDFVSLQKDTSLVSILGVAEIVLTATNEVSQDFKFVHYVMAALIFVALTIPLTRLTDWVSRRQGWVGGGAIR